MFGPKLSEKALVDLGQKAEEKLTELGQRLSSLDTDPLADDEASRESKQLAATVSRYTEITGKLRDELTRLLKRIEKAPPSPETEQESLWRKATGELDDDIFQELILVAKGLRELRSIYKENPGDPKHLEYSDAHYAVNRKLKPLCIIGSAHSTDSFPSYLLPTAKYIKWLENNSIIESDGTGKLTGNTESESDS